MRRRQNIHILYGPIATIYSAARESKIGYIDSMVATRGSVEAEHTEGWTRSAPTQEEHKPPCSKISGKTSSYAISSITRGYHT